MPSPQASLRPIALLPGRPQALPAFAQNVALKPVQVIGTTPVPGMDLPRDEIPANVQTLDASALQASGDPTVAETMARRLPSVTINEVQGNPWQPDLNDRRYATAGALAENAFTNAGQFQANPDDWRDQQFIAPGAPRAGGVGVRYRWGAQ